MKSALKWIAFLAAAALIGYATWTHGVSPYVTQTTCPACGGTGEVIGELPGLGRLLPPSKGKVPCKWCQGGGRVSVHQAEVISAQRLAQPQ